MNNVGLEKYLLKFISIKWEIMDSENVHLSDFTNMLVSLNYLHLLFFILCLGGIRNILGYKSDIKLKDINNFKLSHFT